MVGTVRQIRQRESQNELNTSLRHISNYLENHAFCATGSNTCEHYRRQSHDGWSKYRIHVQTWRLYTTIHVCWNICVWASNVWCNFASGTCYFLQWTTTSIAQRYRILRLTRQTSRDLHMGEAEQATLRSIRQPRGGFDARGSFSVQCVGFISHAFLYCVCGLVVRLRRSQASATSTPVFV